MQEKKNKTLSDDTVSDYLRNNPEFFERNAHLLAEVHLPSPHGEGTISLTERQQLAQRDKIQATESIMEELVEYGKKNDITNQQLHALSLSLMTNTSLEAMAETIAAHIKAPFSLSHASLHCWGVDQDSILGTPEAFSTWMAQQIAPYCGESNDATKLLVEAKIIADDINSFALIPLFTPTGEETNQASPSMGVLILGSTDATHFNADMGTLFLQRIGELLSAALIRIATA
jgi:uncharacterized protein YigA (DUF484 family)